MRVSPKEVNYSHYSCEILMKPEFSGDILEISSYIKFNGNPASNSRVVPCRRPNTHTKLIMAFRNFANAPNNQAVPAGYQTEAPTHPTAGHVRPRQASHSREARGIGPQHG